MITTFSENKTLTGAKSVSSSLFMLGKLFYVKHAEDV